MPCRIFRLSTLVSIPFRAVTGFEPYSLESLDFWRGRVSIPFRAVTGFEHNLKAAFKEATFQFQSLSGLSLGLNSGETVAATSYHRCFNPFQGCHWV